MNKYVNGLFPLVWSSFIQVVQGTIQLIILNCIAQFLSHLIPSIEGVCVCCMGTMFNGSLHFADIW